MACLARRCNRFTLGSARRDHEHHRAGGKLLKPIVIPSDACLRPGIIRTECARLHGVISLTPNALPVLKRHAFIFDKFHLTDLNQELSWTLTDDVAPSLNADLAFLQEKNLIAWLPHRKATMKQTAVETEAHMRYIASLSEEILNDVVAGSEDTTTGTDAENGILRLGRTRQLSQNDILAVDRYSVSGIRPSAPNMPRGGSSGS